MKSRTCHVALTIIMLAQTVRWSLAQSTYEPYTFTTLAGNAGYGSADGTGSVARFNFPRGVAVDSAGTVYVADTYNDTIRKVTPAGLVTTLAGLSGSTGSADGTGSAAQFDHPDGVAVDSAGNVYVADSHNNTIRKVTPAGLVTSLAGLAGSQGSADGTGSDARFSYPLCVAVDNAGNVYVADYGNHTIRKVTPLGVVTTLAGLAGNPGSADGTGSDARFSNPLGVALDNAGNIYVADFGNHTIRKVTPAGVVTTLAELAGSFNSPHGGVAVDSAGNVPQGSVVGDSVGNVYVADSGNHTIRKMTPTGVVSTLAGLAGNPGNADGTGSDARFYYPSGLAVDSTGNLYVADYYNSTIRKVTPAGLVTTLAGLAGCCYDVNGSPVGGNLDGTGSSAEFNRPSGVAVDSAGNVYVADTDNATIRKVTPAGVVTTLAGGGRGSADGTGSDVRFSHPNAVAVDSAGNVYVADSRIRKVTPAGVVTTLAGGGQGSADGTGSAAQFGSIWGAPSGVAVDNAGNVYVADYSNGTIRKVTSAGVVTTLAGLAGSFGSTDGTGSAARFGARTGRPAGVAVDTAGNIYVGDSDNNTIRKVTTLGVVTTLAGLAGSIGSADGTGSAVRFNRPYGVAVDSAGNVYVVDTGSHTIRKVTQAGVVTTLGGSVLSSQRNADGTGSTARFSFPNGVAVDSEGNVYVADTGNNAIRKGFPAPRILNSGPGFGFNDGQFGFNLTGPMGKSVVVEASSDLTSWLPIWTNTFAFPTTLNFSDPPSGVSPNRFYRAHLP